MEQKDVLAVQKLLSDDVTHWFLPKEDIVYTFVVEEESGNITDFISFYILSSTITPPFKAAYFFLAL